MKSQEVTRGFSLISCLIPDRADTQVHISRFKLVTKAVPRGSQDPEYVRGAFARIADNYALANHLLSAGTDILWRRKAGRMVANLQITAGQLKLAAVEIRRSPWRLLHRPDDQEYETDNLYDAARSFALAAGALEASAASLQSVLEYDAVEKDQLQQKLDYFEKLFGKFKETEQSFWDALQKQAPVE